LSSTKRELLLFEATKTHTERSGMGYLTFFGSLLFVFGPPLALFVLVIAKSNQLIILAIGRFVFCTMTFEYIPPDY
jgi:hypothetical protein